MTKHLITYEPFSILVVPFPFTDSPKNKRRPAVVLSSKLHQDKTGHITLLMITSAFHTSWFGDHLIKNRVITGLQTDCIIRQKIFTIDMRLIIREIGKLSEIDIEAVIHKLGQHIITF